MKSKKRDPRIDPRPGDVTRGDTGGKYEVLRVTARRVYYIDHASRNKWEEFVTPAEWLYFARTDRVLKRGAD